MDDEAFVAALEASPDDPALKAVYADWLEQRGDPRAELLRLDDELWRTPVDLMRVRTIERRRLALRSACDPRWIVRASRPSFVELRRRLEILGNLQHEQDVAYQLREPLPLAEVEALEARLGCRLPAQYRRFVTELADGGTGPWGEIHRLTDAVDTYLVPPSFPWWTLEGGLPLNKDPYWGHWLRIAGPDAGSVWQHSKIGFVPEVVRGVPITVERDLIPAGIEASRAARRLAAQRESYMELIDWLVQGLDQVLWGIAQTTVDGAEVFERPPAQVTELNFRKAGLTAVPDGLRRMSAVSVLDLSWNPIEELPAWIGELVELEQLQLSGTQLRRLPESLGDLRALSQLDLGHTSTLEQLPGSIGRLSQLRSLDVERCGLVTLPDSIGDLTLTELDLTGNRLVRLPASVGRMKLQTLKLTSNLLTELPDELEHLTELTELDLSDNPLTTLPGWIPRLPRLETLRLDELPALDLVDACRKLQHARTLRHLSLHQDGHTGLPEEIGLLTQLEWLHICGSDFTSLPSSLARLTRLHTFFAHCHDDWFQARVRELLPHLRDDRRDRVEAP